MRNKNRTYKIHLSLWLQVVRTKAHILIDLDDCCYRGMEIVRVLAFVNRYILQYTIVRKLQILET